MMNRYFISDAHLFPEPGEHPGREMLLSFLDHLAGIHSPGELWILGDLFDFWFEYGTVMPAGHGRCLSSIRRLAGGGWGVHFLPGNHDYWVGPHFREATGAVVHTTGTVELTSGPMRVLLAHGDGLGPGDLGYRLMKPVLRSPLSMFMFRVLHPGLGSYLARRFSDTSRRILRRDLDSIPEGLKNWVDGKLEDGYDLVITGHTHLDKVVESKKGIYVSLGDWLTRFTYCRLEDGSGKPELLSYAPPEPQSDTETGNADNE